jgi:hypothetical protein
MGDLGWEPVRDLVRADRRGALVTIVAGPGVGARLLVTPDAVEGSLGDPALDEEATRVARELLPGEKRPSASSTAASCSSTSTRPSRGC